MEVRKELLGIKCPIGITQNILEGKWKLVIIYKLRNGIKRFNELQKGIPGIRHSYLTKQLRELERDGIVHREVYNTVPPKVEYSLTEMGTEFLGILEKMYEWGTKYIGHIRENS